MIPPLYATSKTGDEEVVRKVIHVCGCEGATNEESPVIYNT